MEATGFCGFVVWAFETVGFLCIHWYLLGSVKRTLPSLSLLMPQEPSFQSIKLCDSYNSVPQSHLEVPAQFSSSQKIALLSVPAFFLEPPVCLVQDNNYANRSV